MLGCFAKRTGAVDTALESDTRDVLAAKAKPPFNSTERLSALRGLMEDAKLDYYILLSTDAHQSEFTGPHDKRLQFISGYSGEGTAVIGRDDARLFLNGIYWTEGAEMTDDNWTIMKVGQKNVPTWSDYVAALSDTRIGYDDRFIDLATFQQIRKKSEGRNVDLVFTGANLVERLWTDQPKPTESKIFIQGKNLTGKDASEKLSELRKDIKELGGASYVAYDLAEIAWLLNLVRCFDGRASDQPTTPIFFSYALVTATETVLFVRSSQVDHDVRRYLQEDLKVTIKPYDDARTFLEAYDSGDKPVLMMASTPYFLPKAIGEDKVKIVQSPIAERRAVKNPVELANMREAYLQDATAWIQWLAWLEEQAKCGTKLTEFECGQKLEQYAQKLPNYFCPAYTPLFQCGPNGAKPHYSPTKDKTDVIDFDKMIVADIGFNWRNGTCDTTRTLHLKPHKASHKERRAFTRVLQGHIAVDTAHFPESSGTGASVEALARQFLWKDGLDYKHGTGHGLGSFLNVHETPPMIAARSDKNFTVGNTMSNEPGFYLSGHFGTRTESVITVVKVKTKFGWGDDDWLGFERITRVPIQKSLVDWSIMTPDDVKWLHDHNELCKRDMKNRVKHDKRALRWLKKQ